MRISKIVTAVLLCLLIISCGGNGKSKKREPARRNNRKTEIIEKRKATVEEKEDKETPSRNNGNYRKPSQRKKGESKLRRKTKGRVVLPPEEDPAKVSAAKIEKRVQLEVDIWKAKEKGNEATVSKLRNAADDLAKEMSQKELDEAFKRLKDLKKRM
jgi:hypothetical protein